MHTFSPALKEMSERHSWFRDPESFVDYLERYSLTKKATAAFISVDSIKMLDRELRDARVMVFRLGHEIGGRTTHFALAKSQEPDLSDFFFLDEQIFKNRRAELFIPSVSYQKLFSFKILPYFSETSFINLAVSSGLLGHALDLDVSNEITAPATGRTTFSFDVRPRSSNKKKWRHNQGQVEIDAILTGKRRGKPVLVIVEGKASKGFDSLAKHKLIYPYLSLLHKIPRYMDIILGYIRIINRQDGFHFFVAECKMPQTDYAIDQLMIKKARHIILKI